LKQKPKPQPKPSAMFADYDMLCSFNISSTSSSVNSYPSPRMARESMKKPDVEAAIIKVASATPKCKQSCGVDLVLVSVGSQECYNGGNVNCDICKKSLPPGSNVWHCPKERTSYGHKDGYDICEECGNEQLKWDELNGLSKIERDEQFPVRVTLQYYQATSNGVVDAEIMTIMASMLESSQKHADFVGSLVTTTDKNRPTEWVDEKEKDKSNDNFVSVKKLLQETFPDNFKDLLDVFVGEKFDDSVLNSIDSKEDLSEVLTKAGDRIKFFKAIQTWKQNNTSVDFMTDLLG